MEASKCVDFVSQPVQGTTTGKCVVLTTPDAHRTLVSDFGNAMGVLRSFDNADDELQAMLRPTALEEALRSSALLLVEGYLFEMGDAVVESMIANAAHTAKAFGIAPRIAMLSYATGDSNRQM